LLHCGYPQERVKRSPESFQKTFAARLTGLNSGHPETPDGQGAVFDLERAVFRKVKEIKDLSGGVVLYAAQSNPPMDAEIAEKSRSRTKTK